MPSLAPVLPAGSLNRLVQPAIGIRDGMTLRRPGARDDANAVMTAFSVAAHAARAVTEWGFTTPGLHRIFLTHSVRNEPSCRVAVAAGFAQEGTLRRYQRLIDGSHDVHVRARLADDR